jgi:hypothetical protein
LRYHIPGEVAARNSSLNFARPPNGIDGRVAAGARFQIPLTIAKSHLTARAVVATLRIEIIHELNSRKATIQ